MSLYRRAKDDSGRCLVGDCAGCEYVRRESGRRWASVFRVASRGRRSLWRGNKPDLLPPDPGTATKAVSRALFLACLCQIWRVVFYLADMSFIFPLSPGRWQASPSGRPSAVLSSSPVQNNSDSPQRGNRASPAAMAVPCSPFFLKYVYTIVYWRTSLGQKLDCSPSSSSRPT